MNNIGKLTTPTGVGSSIQVSESGQVDIIGQIKFTSSPTNSANDNIGFSGNSTTDELRISGSPIWLDGGYFILYPRNTIDTNTNQIADYAGGFCIGCIDTNDSTKKRELRCFNNNNLSPNGLFYSDDIAGHTSYWDGIISTYVGNNIWAIKYSSGLIIHWGYGSTPSTDPLTINFLTPYKHSAIVSYCITGIADNNNNDYTLRCNNSTTFVAFRSYKDSNVVPGIGFTWMTIGY